MKAWEHRDTYAADTNQEIVTRDLSEALFHGELAFLLGAGISRELGLPSWSALVRSCLSSVGLSNNQIGDKSSFEELTRAARDFHEQCKKDGLSYLDIVQTHLYEHMEKREKMSGTPLLTAISAMLMGSRRGQIREVWTLNFDDLLEWHLRVHGFASQAVTDVPCLMRNTDVTIYHPHGFLPMDTRHGIPSSEIIFDDKSYATRAVGKWQPWREAMQWALRSRVFLAVGLSWSDDLLKKIIFDAADDNQERPTAFWLFGPQDCDSAKTDDCLRNNVVPLIFESEKFTDYAPFLLGICEAAMQRMNR